MLQNIVHNSNRLIKSQYLDEDSILNQLIKLKNKRRNLSSLESSYHGPIFQQPQFNHHVDLKNINKRNRVYMTSQNFRNRSKSQQASKTLQKINPIKNIKPQKQFDFILDDEIMFNDTKKTKIIHSRKNMETLSIPKNPKIHHRRVFKTIQKSNKNKQTIQQPNLTNLCFYKNTLQEINTMRSARLSMRKKNVERNFSQRQKSSNKNKIIFTANKNIGNDKNPDCRPWSPKNDNDSVQGEFLCFKSLTLKI